MANTFTTNYSLTKPEVGADTNAWGTHSNANWDTLDSTLFTVSGVATAALPKAGGTMTGALILAAGALGTPSLTFTGDTDNGLYYVGTNHFALVGGGSPALDINGTVVTAPGSFVVVGATTLTGAVAANGKLTTAAATTGGAGLNIAPGVAPTSPVNGDLWTTSGGFFARIAGVTVQPLVAQNNLSDLSSLPTTLTNLGFSNSLTGNGYQILPGGLYLQWGTATITSGVVGVTFPIAFPSNLFSIQVTPIGSSVDASVAISASSRTGVNVVGGIGGANSNFQIYWFAVGN